MAAATDERVAPGAEAAATILPETPRNKNSLSVVPDGPLYVRGNLEIEETPGAEILPDTRVGFCRCGASENKPLCDQSHARVGFRCGAAVAPRAGPASPVSEEKAPVRFTPQPNGPLLFRGPLTIAGRGGREGDARPGETLPVRTFEGQALLRRLAPRRGIRCTLTPRGETHAGSTTGC